MLESPPPSFDAVQEAYREEARNRRTDRLQERYNALMKFALMAGVLAPLLIMWSLGSELDRYLRGAGPLLTVLTFAAPVLICFTFASEIVCVCLLEEAFQRDLDALSRYPRQRSDAYARLSIRYLWLVRGSRAAALIVPAALFWIFASSLDAAFGKSGAAVLLPFGTMVAAWLSVTKLLIPRVLRPRKDRLREAIRAQEERARAAADASK